MSDALCGPSNPLQQFKQQSQTDRTLQQDRLASRQSPAHGFRTQDPNAGLLDAEFEAFQAGVPVSDLPQFHHQQEQASFHKQAPFAGVSQTPSWATDFQRMNIHSPAPSQQPHFAPQQTGGNVNWAQDFQQHLGQAAPRAQNSSPSPWAFQQRARYGMTGGFQSSFAQQGLDGVQSKGKAPVREEFDEAAFDRAFDMLAEEQIEPVAEQPLQTALRLDDASSMEDAIAQALKDQVSDPEMVLGNVSADGSNLTAEDLDYNGAGLAEAIRNEQDQGIHDEPMHDPRTDDDALAATAEELLEKVKDNRSDKFQNSQFLSLMRKLKDREVRVDGDQMVETTASTSNSTAEPALKAPSTGPVDPRQRDYRQPPFPQTERTIPLPEQDQDAYRGNPRDGQDVVDLLAGQFAPGDDIDSEFMMTSPFGGRSAEPPVFENAPPAPETRDVEAVQAQFTPTFDSTRESTARRAANTTGSEEQSTRSRPTESGMTEVETTEQESFEARVARIKARVAQLTKGK